MAPVIETHDLAKHFGAVRAVDGIDVAVERGEIFGLLGPNGAGKTTTIRLLLDFVRPTAGTCSLFGEHARSVAVRARVGYLPADLAVDPRWTAREALGHIAALRRRSGLGRASEIAERFSLDLDRPFGELSTGNKRKVGIAQALMHDPDLLILDEPTSGLDPILQREFHEFIEDRAASGATVFLSSHVLPEVDRLAERVAIVADGRVVATDHVSALRDRARHFIELTFAAPVDPTSFSTLSSVQQVEASGATLRLEVHGAIDEVVKAASQHTVERIVSPEPDLETIFLDLYPRSEA